MSAGHEEEKRTRISRLGEIQAGMLLLLLPCPDCLGRHRVQAIRPGAGLVENKLGQVFWCEFWAITRPACSATDGLAVTSTAVESGCVFKIDTGLREDGARREGWALYNEEPNSRPIEKEKVPCKTER